MIADQLTFVEPAPAPAQRVAEPGIAIGVRGVGKMYRIYNRPQDRLKQMLFWRMGKSYGHEFWALRNTSFQVGKGETVGIIGRNGSGKSTLLQIIAGTLAPTEGEVQVNGRVAALLELGSGFNPEFTGRENVFMNGAILGVGREQMERRFDEIAAFADIGEFIEQPVKLYSSGMVLRLAFAVQLFVPKEVLIVDEALSVGDEAFQRKCMAAIKEFQEQGGTILLVSHSTQTIVRHCERCLLLSHGEVVADDGSKVVTDLYQKLMYSEPQKVKEMLATIRQHGVLYALSCSQATDTADLAPQSLPAQIEERDILEDWFDPNMPKTGEVTYGNGYAEIFSFGMFNQQGDQVNILVVGRRYEWTYQVYFRQEAYDVHFGTILKTVDGVDVAGISSEQERIYFDHIPANSTVKVAFSIKMNIAPGTYFLNAGVDGHIEGEYTFLHRRVDICMIRVLSHDNRGIYGLAYLEPHFKAELTIDNTTS